MADTDRLDRLTEVVEQTGSKLVAIGDAAQLPSIGAGGMFDRLAEIAPSAELSNIRRTLDRDEQRAWADLRAGRSDRAMAHYHARGQLHMAHTRDEAVEHAVQDWAKLTETHPIEEVALISDASNQEIHRLNARAQHLRAQREELGELEAQVPGVHYGVRQGDRIVMIEQHREHGARAHRERQPRRSPRHHPSRRRADRVRHHRPASEHSPAKTSAVFGSGTRSTSTVPKAPPSPARSLSPVAGRRARSPPTSRHPAPEKAPTGTSPARISASKGTTPTASNAWPRTCSEATHRHHRLPTPSWQTATTAPTSTARSRPAAQAAYRGSSARSTASSTHHHRSEHDEPTTTNRPTRPRRPPARRLAAAADTPPSTLAAQMVQTGVALAAKDGKVRPLRPAPALVGGNCSERAPWLEPYGGDADWRQQMWGAVVALHGRYPTQLQALKDKWWKDDSQTETLCALAAWRAELDDAGQDPRDSSPSRTSSPTTPKSCASRAAASPRHGSQVRHRPSGPRSSGPTSPTVTSLAASVTASRHTPTGRQGLCTADLQLRGVCPGSI